MQIAVQTIMPVRFQYERPGWTSGPTPQVGFTPKREEERR